MKLNFVGHATPKTKSKCFQSWYFHCLGEIFQITVQEAKANVLNYST